MSRVANSPGALPKGVDIKIEGLNLSVKGGKGTLDLTLTDGVGVNVEEDVATITYEGDSHRAMAVTLVGNGGHVFFHVDAHTIGQGQIQCALATLHREVQPLDFDVHPLGQGARTICYTRHFSNAPVL